MDRNIQTLRDIMQNRLGAQIVCAVTGKVVRYLAVIGDRCDLKTADGDQFGLSLDAAIRYEPWFMDRGSVLVESEHGTIKLCTEFDVIRYDDGTAETVDCEAFRRADQFGHGAGW